MIINIALIDGDNNFAKEVGSFIDRRNTQAEHTCQVKHFTSGVDFISDYQPIFDIVILDIALPMMDGLEVARKLRNIDKYIPIIFATSATQYAIKGYEVNALDFWEKPIAYLSFAQKLQKAIDLVTMKKDYTIMVKTKVEYRVISVRDIKYVEVFGHILIYHLVDGEVSVRGTLSSLEKILADLHFIRCNDCYLINLRYVDAANSTSVTVDGHTFSISRRKKKEFKEKWLKLFEDGAVNLFQ